MASESGPNRRHFLAGATAATAGLALGGALGTGRAAAASAEAAARPSGHAPAQSGSQPPPGSLQKPGWILTRHDEFDGPLLDTGLWVPRYLGFRTPFDVGATNYQLQDGSIVITVTKDMPPLGTNPSLPAEQVSSIQTAQGNFNQGSYIDNHDEPFVIKFAQQYGWFEICSKGQADESGHSAFWLNTADPSIFAQGQIPGVPNCLEIDVFEAGRGNVYATSILTPGDPGQDTQYGTYPFSIDSGYHVYAMEWTPTSVNIYVDGQLVKQHDGRRVIAAPMFVYLSLYTNSQFGNGSAPIYPSQFSIDYFRVYQRDVDLALAGTASGAGIANPGAAIDGRPGTAATGVTGPTAETLTVSFGVGQNVSRAALQGQLPDTYSIQVPADGSTWTTVATEQDGADAGPVRYFDFPEMIGVLAVRLQVPAASGAPQHYRITRFAFTDVYLINQDFDDEVTGQAPLGWIQRRPEGAIVVDNQPSATDKSIAISQNPGSTMTSVAEKHWPVQDGLVSVSARVESGSPDVVAELPAVLDPTGTALATIMLAGGAVVATAAGGASQTLSSGPYAAGSWHDVKLVVDSHASQVTATYDDQTATLPLKVPAQTAGVRFSLGTADTEIHADNVVVRAEDALLDA